MKQPLKQWEELSKNITQCSQCSLRSTCSRVVIGSGNSKAKILFIGEAPGKKEDENGIPFVGSSGKLLDTLLASIHLKREDVYITNVVKCRPPDNRDPSLEEIQTCSPWLIKQISYIHPEIIVTLGRHSLHFFLPHLSISLSHGQAHQTKLPLFKTSFSVFAAYHPAAALYNGKLRETIFSDFAKIPNLLEKKKNK